MHNPVTWVRGRLGERGLGVALLVGLLALAVVPLAVLPATRCEVFGGGCPEPVPEVRADPVVARKAPTPVEAATRGAYVALGDSYSAGLGAEASVADKNPLDRCHRTSKAYYHEVSRAFRFAGGSAFWACSGATIPDFLKGRGGEPAQLGRIGPETSLVTLSIGGNDVGFSRVLAGCVIKLPWSKSCIRQGEDVAERMAVLRRTLPDLIGQITARAPRARVILMGYPKAFSEVDGVDGDNITVADQRWLNARAYDLGRLIRQSAEEADARIAARRGQGSVEFVDAYSAFAGHEVGSRDAYMNGLLVNLPAFVAEPRSYHPTIAGQQALARLFVEQVKKGPGRPLS
ncbi:GDSL-like lipase/acylhydrolase family protein [Actinomadura pelletieri DSM 43383]|uniref:GDSL-like lipase/acylhydrolase family protein n=1 Tax=Actinomadura pelletieri DSM 43383 TaxID=1120940 RepID=A0A495QNB9_9ACTN|nr:SGNH/GDSL hydrolase family protein [Actinomadura pelletieri]RKS74419.1 GDSL-like lipase/acylhydrolase family protein [Actinomadura pelletieri DSM 43383]